MEDDWAYNDSESKQHPQQNGDRDTARKEKWERLDSSWKKEKGSGVDILEWDDEPQQLKERGGGAYESQSFE